MKFAVTGSSGFLGSLLCRTLLDCNFSVTGITSGLRPSSLATADFIRRPDFQLSISRYDHIPSLLLSLLGSDVVIHCAALAHQTSFSIRSDVNLFLQSNVVNALNVFDACISAGVSRFVFISSIGVFGSNTSEKYKFTESSVPSPTDPYSLSKLSAELLLRERAAESNIDLIIIRPPLIYGPGAKGNFKRLMRLVSTGYPLPFSMAKNMRTFVGLHNLVDFIISSSVSSSSVNRTLLVSDITLSLAELLSSLTNAFSAPTVYFPVHPKILIASSWLLGKYYEMHRLLSPLVVDSSYSHNLIGWNPSHSFESELSSMVRFYQLRPD